MLHYIRNYLLTKAVKRQIAPALPVSMRQMVVDTKVTFLLHDEKKPIPGVQIQANECVLLARYSMEKMPVLRDVRPNCLMHVARLLNVPPTAFIDVSMWMDDSVLIGIWMQASTQRFPWNVSAYSNIQQIHPPKVSASPLKVNANDVATPRERDIQNAVKAALDQSATHYYGAYLVSVPSASDRLCVFGRDWLVLGQDDAGNYLALNALSGHDVYELIHNRNFPVPLEMTLGQVLKLLAKS